jgi:hypothetical protein
LRWHALNAQTPESGTFWQGVYTISACSGGTGSPAGGPADPCVEALNWPNSLSNSGTISFRLGSAEQYDFRRDYSAPGYTQVCKADTIYISKGTLAETAYGGYDSQGQPATTSISWSIVSETVDFIKGTFSSTFPYITGTENGQYIISYGNVSGTWQVSPLSQPFPKCDPPGGSDLYCTPNVNSSSPSGAPCSQPFLPVTSSARSGEWISAGCPAPTLTLNGNGTTEMIAIFEPGMSLQAAAAACGFIGFDWVQRVTSLPTPNPYRDSHGSSLQAPFYDPPDGGYITSPQSQQPPFLDATPFYYNPAYLDTGCVAYTESDGCTPIITTLQGGRQLLAIADAPQDPCLPGGALTFTAYCEFSAAPYNAHLSFTTSLVGIYPGNQPSAPLFSWSWIDNFNGLSSEPVGNGGVSFSLSTIYPVIPGSGTGGITITVINNIQLPTPLNEGQIYTLASGLAYSRVTQTFNGRVALKNIGETTVAGPLQLLLFKLPGNVTLVNATGNLSGTPYIAPGQSITVPVQLKNPSNATINIAPAIYSGSLSQ